MSIWRLGSDGDSLPDGLYEDLVSESLRRRLDALRASHASVGTASLGDDEASEHLARAIAQALRVALDDMQGARAAERLPLANRLLAEIVKAAPAAFRAGESALEQELLLHLLSPRGLG
ncbi:MAG: hypothetical protein ACRELB_12470, partial [Polyangiaceae bacterium]